MKKTKQINPSAKTPFLMIFLSISVVRFSSAATSAGRRPPWLSAPILSRSGLRLPWRKLDHVVVEDFLHSGPDLGCGLKIHANPEAQNRVLS